ncbi:hypothetical protein COCOBI_12-1590 [Coccomyxa sp. Obi]|nr:hypothetical protein COCOBI_12-1590 [Coccomyxa sp. Obi]
MAAAASLDELPEGAGGEEADLHTLVPDSISRQAELPGLLRNALEARAAASNDSVNCVFSRLVAQCFIRYSKENVDLAAALLTLACLGEGKEISWANEPRLRFLLGLHAVREASRFLPSELSNGGLEEAEKWRCDSRTAACACLLLLCAARESLAHPADSLHFIGALTDVCDALGRSTGHDSMVWGCDLDPGNWASQRPQPGSGPAAAPEPAGIIDNPGTPVASGMSMAAGPSAPDEDRADAAAVSSVGGQQGSAEAEGSAKDVAGQPATAPPVQSLDQAKVDQLMQKLDEQLQLLRQATPLLRQRADQMTDKEAAAVRRQLALVLDQQTDFFESNMQALRENLPKMQLPAGDLIFPGIGWPPNVAAPAAQMPVLGIPVPDLTGRVSLQHDLAAALSLHRPADSPAESANHHNQQQQPASRPSASSEAAGKASGDGGALAGKLAALAASKAPESRSGPMKISHGTVDEEGKVQATWAVVRAAVPLLKQLAGGKLHAASPAVAPELCRALSCLCCRTSPCGRAFAGHIFKECAAHIAKLLKSEESRGAVGPVLLLSQLLLSELPAPSKARYPPIPPSASLKISSVFVQLGVVEHLRQRLMDATEALTKEPSRQPNAISHPGGEQSGITRGYEALATVTCEALSLFAVNSASHRSLQAAGTFQTTLSLLGSSPECHISMETEAMALELVRALAAHCPSVAESAALWGQTGLPALSAHLRPGHDTGLREAAAAALDAILRLHKTQAVKEVLAKGMRIRGLLDKYDAVRGENLRFFPELRHRVAKMLRVLAYDSGGAALPELLRPGKEGCVPWLVNELGNTSTHWCTRAELAAVLGSLARIPALSAAMARSRRSVAGKDIMLDPRAGIRKAGAMGPLMALLKEVTENKTHALNNEIVVNALAGVIGVGITYIKDDEDILPILKAELLPQLLRVMDVKLMTGSEGQRKLMLGNATILAYCLRWPEFRDEFVRRGGHIVATDLMIWCANNEPPAPAPGKDDFHMETVCTLVNIIGNAARSSVKALEYINEQGGLPIAARYLARAVALPPSNTSWYMGLSNGAAGLCDLQAVLVNNPKVAAAVAEICMVGLATTAHATRGPPKPDKARIDRLAYVVTSLSTLATYLKASAPGAIADALERGTFQQLLDLRRTLHLSNATIGYLQAFVQSSRNPTKDAAMANANMCQLLEEEAREKEREAREAARKLKRKLKKAEARLRSQEEESASLRAQLAAAELDSSSGTSPDRPGATAAADSTPEDTSPAKEPQPSVAAAAAAEAPAPVAPADGGRARRGKKKGKAVLAPAEELAGRQNGGPATHARDSSVGQSAEGSDGDEEEARSEGALPDSWETMAEEEDDGGGVGVITDFNAVYGVSPPDSGSWTTVGLKKPAAAALPGSAESTEVDNGKAQPATPSTAASPAPAPVKQQKGWARLPATQPPPPPPAQSSSEQLQQDRSRQGSWGNGPTAPPSGAHRASLRAIAAAQNHTANMLKAQVGGVERSGKEAAGPVSWSSVAAGSASTARGLPPPSPSPVPAEAAQEPPAAPAAWGVQRQQQQPRTTTNEASAAPQPLPNAPPPELSAEFLAPSRGSQPSTAWDSREVSESGLHSPASSRLSAPASPTASHATVRTLSSDAAADSWTRLGARPAPGDTPTGPDTPVAPAGASPAQLPGNLSPAMAPAPGGLFTSSQATPSGALWEGGPSASMASSAPGQPPPASAQLASLWGPASDSPVGPVAEDVWSHKQSAQQGSGAEQSLAQERSGNAGPALPDSLFGDPWAGLNRPGGGNPWSLHGDLGSPEATPAAPAAVRKDIASAAAHVSQLNPSAGVFNAQGAAAASHVAFPAQAPQPAPHATQVQGVQHGLDRASSGMGGSIWGAPGMSGAAASGSGWSSGFQALSSQGSNGGAPSHGDGSVWGASPPFNDAPAFLSSLMQQVLPEEDALLPGAIDPVLLHHTIRQQQQQQQQQQQHHMQQQLQMQQQLMASSAEFQLGNLFNLPMLSGAAQAQRHDPRSLWQQQAVGQLFGQQINMGTSLPYPVVSGAAAAMSLFGGVSAPQARGFHAPSARPMTEPVSMPTPAARYGAGMDGPGVRQLPQRGVPPGMQGFGQPSPDKGPQKRPSDVVHAFAQASQQARAQANNMQRYAPAQTPSAAIAAAGGQPPPGFRLPTAKQQPIGLPSERLGAMGGHARSSAGD